MIGNMLEQPLKSLQVEHYRLVAVFKLLRMTPITTYMGSFDAPTSKPTRLIANTGWHHELIRPDVLKGKATVEIVIVDSKGGITGKKKELKDTQDYTERFGTETTAAYVSWHKRTFPKGHPEPHIVRAMEANSPLTDKGIAPLDMWEDANLRGVAQSMGFKEEPAYYPWETPTTKRAAVTVS